MSIRSMKFIACACLAISAVALGYGWTNASAASETGGSSAIALQPADGARPQLTSAAFLDDEREDGEKREAREREGERREGAEGREREQPRRDGEPRQEAAGQRREGDRPRDGDARREGDRPREGDARREGEARRETFRPKTENEEALYRMIVQLQREVAELRNALRSRDGGARREGGDREGVRDQPRRDGDQPRRETDRPRERDGERPAAPREGERRDSDGS